MRVAIATFGAEVSPRFCCAREFLLVDLDVEGDPGSRHPLGDTVYPDRLRLLERLGVELLVCGGFPRAQLPAAACAGLRVISGVTGPVATALEAVRAGHPIPTRHRGGVHQQGRDNPCPETRSSRSRARAGRGSRGR